MSRLFNLEDFDTIFGTLMSMIDTQCMANFKNQSVKIDQYVLADYLNKLYTMKDSFIREVAKTEIDILHATEVYMNLLKSISILITEIFDVSVLGTAKGTRYDYISRHPSEIVKTNNRQESTKERLKKIKLLYLNYKKSYDSILIITNILRASQKTCARSGRKQSERKKLAIELYIKHVKEYPEYNDEKGRLNWINDNLKINNCSAYSSIQTIKRYVRSCNSSD